MHIKIITDKHRLCVLKHIGPIHYFSALHQEDHGTHATEYFQTWHQFTAPFSPTTNKIGAMGAMVPAYFSSLWPGRGDATDCHKNQYSWYHNMVCYNLKYLPSSVSTCLLFSLVLTLRATT